VIVPPILLQDGSGGIWLIGVSHGQITETLSSGVAPLFIPINDTAIVQTYSFSIFTDGQRILTPATFNPYAIKALLVVDSYDGSLYELRVLYGQWVVERPKPQAFFGARPKWRNTIGTGWQKRF